MDVTMIALYLLQSSDLLPSSSFPTRRSSDLFERHAIGVQQTQDVVVGVNDERRRLGERRILRENARVHEPASLIVQPDRKSTRLNSSHTVISYAVFCLKRKKLTLPVCKHETT